MYFQIKLKNQETVLIVKMDETAGENFRDKRASWSQ